MRCMSACISSYQKILSKQNRQNLILYWPTQKLPLYAAMNTLQTTLYKMLSFQNEFDLILAQTILNVYLPEKAPKFNSSF